MESATYRSRNGGVDADTSSSTTAGGGRSVKPLSVGVVVSSSTARGAVSPIPIPRTSHEARSAYLGGGDDSATNNTPRRSNNELLLDGDSSPVTGSAGKNSVVFNLSGGDVGNANNTTTSTATSGRSPAAARQAKAQTVATVAEEESRHKLVQVIAQRNNAINRTQQLESAAKLLNDRIQQQEADKVNLQTRILQLEQKVELLSDDLAMERENNSQLAHIKAMQKDNKAPPIRSASPATGHQRSLPASGTSTPISAGSGPEGLARSRSMNAAGLSGAQIRERERDAQVRHLVKELKDENRELKARVAELEAQQSMMVPYPSAAGITTPKEKSSSSTGGGGSGPSAPPSRAASSNALLASGSRKNSPNNMAALVGSSRKGSNAPGGGGGGLQSPARRSQGTSTPAAASFVPPQRFIASISVAAMENAQRGASSANGTPTSRNPSSSRRGPSPVSRQTSSAPRGASPSAAAPSRRSSPFDRTGTPSKRTAPPPPGRQSPLYSRNASSAGRSVGGTTPVRSGSASRGPAPKVSVASSIRAKPTTTTSAANNTKKPVITSASKAASSKKKASSTTAVHEPTTTTTSSSLRPSRMSPVRDETVSFSSEAYATKYHPTRMVRHYEWEDPGEKVATSTSAR